jgi:superoxide dismutase, Fe-Mn family
MHTYAPRTFTLGTLGGLSDEQIKVHLGLYEGYVKHMNVLREQIAELTALDKEKYAFAIMETRRRLGFEFNGMRMHEYYFEQLEGGASTLSGDSALAKAVSEKYGSVDDFMTHVKSVAMSRGIGWSVLYADPIGKTVHTAWVADHELGQLGGLPIIFALDMWEHAFMVDYRPATKKDYVEAFMKNVNWGVVEKRFTETHD